MKQEDIKTFTYRLSQANRSEAVVIMYDIILKDIEDAHEFCKNNEEEGFTSSLKHAERFLNELCATLVLNSALAYNLRKLYIWSQKELINARMRLDDDPLYGVTPVISGLRSSFREISKSDDSAPLMANSASVYAGLTYGKGTLPELDASASRGILA